MYQVSFRRRSDVTVHLGIYLNACSLDRWMLNTHRTSELAELLRLLGEPNRLRIVTSCLESGAGCELHLPRLTFSR